MLKGKRYFLHEAGSGLLALILLLQSFCDGPLGLTGIVSVLCGQISAVNQVIDFPYRIPGTSLVLERVVSYDGPYVEDESDDEVTEVAAIVLRNISESGMKSAEVILRWSEGCYCFEAFCVPSGAQVLLLEKNKSSFALLDWTSCEGTESLDKDDWTAWDTITVTPTESGRVAIKNISDQVVMDVVIYYKNYLSPPGVLVGGITYSAKIAVLQPGETAEVQLWHFAQGYSRLVRIEYRVKTVKPIDRTEQQSYNSLNIAL